MYVDDFEVMVDCCAFLDPTAVIPELRETWKVVEMLNDLPKAVESLAIGAISNQYKV